MGAPLAYCREIETYLCRKNDGHLIRVVGPSFELVSGWAARGIPLKVAFEGIDRSFDRYYRKGPRRRPLRIDFCEADVLDVFDEWRRAVGVTGVASEPEAEAADGSSRRGGASLPAHLGRAVRRLSEARARGAIGEAFDPLIDRLSDELDRARSERGGLRGDERRTLVERLAALDDELMGEARRSLDAGVLAGIEREAALELAPYHGRMDPDAYSRARVAAGDRLVRARLGLPTLAF